MKASDIDFIIVHCSDSPQGRGDNAETIHQWHLERKFSGIGYHRVILENGVIERGRPLYWAGAHAVGYNDRSIGICLIGDGDYTPVQMSSLFDVIHEMLDRSPSAVVIGHNDINKSKSCPKFDVKKWLLDFQK